MATEEKHTTVPKDTEQRVVENAQHFWGKYGKLTSIVLIVLVLGVGGFFAYRNFVQLPKEKTAAEAMWQAQEFYKVDSFSKALNGDGAAMGFLRIISRYGGTKAGNLAKFYAGSAYLQLQDFNNAVKYLKDFSASTKELDMRATGLLGDAYAEQGKKEEAAGYYEKAGKIFPKDDLNTSEYLFRAAYLYEDMGKTAQAIELFKKLKNDYPNTQRGYDVDKYLGKLGADIE